MSRALSKLFVKLNIGVYAINFAILFVVGMMLLSVTGNLLIYMIPGIFFAGIICLVYPDFYNVIAGLLNFQEITNPTWQESFSRIGEIIQSAFTKDYSMINEGLPTATFCAVVCWIVGIVCLFQQGRLHKIVNSPMDWYKKKKISTFVYSVFGLFYGVTLCVGAFSIIGAKYPNPITGGLLVLAWLMAIFGFVVIAGVAVLIVERFLSVQTFNAMTTQEQIELCEKQAKYMNKRQRRRQVKRLGEKACVCVAQNQPQSEQDKKSQKKRNKKRKSKKAQGEISSETAQPLPVEQSSQTEQSADVESITTVEPTSVDQLPISADEQPLSDEQPLPDEQLPPTEE